MAKITIYKAGYCTHLSCMVARGTGLKNCQFPAQVFLIEANNRRWLWDTGYSSHFKDQTKGIYSIYGNMPKVYFNESESLFNQLTAQGFNESDFDSLIISHFHGDHIAGLRDFNKSHFLASHAGWNYLKDKKGISALLNGFVPGLVPEDFTERVNFFESFKKTALPNELLPFTEGYSLPNSNNEIILVPLNGHAIGHFGAFVNTENGWKLIASDAAWLTTNYRDLVQPMVLTTLIIHNNKTFKETLLKLHELDKKNIKIYLSHEEPTL